MDHVRLIAIHFHQVSIDVLVDHGGRFVGHSRLVSRHWVPPNEKGVLLLPVSELPVLLVLFLLLRRVQHRH